MRIGIVFLLTASGCCLSTVEGENLSTDTTGGFTSQGGTSAGASSSGGGGNTSGSGTGGVGSSSGGSKSTTGGGMGLDSGPCSETCIFPTAQTVSCTSSVIETSATVDTLYDFGITALCESSSSLIWDFSGGTLPAGLQFMQIGAPAVADFSGQPISVPNPNPVSLYLTVRDADGDVGHLQVILTINQ